MFEIYDTKAEVARALSGYLEQWSAEEGFRSIALSGGSTPQVWFDLLADEYQNRLPWPEFLLFWGDERCVPPEDSQSNYRMTREHLLERVPVDSSHISGSVGRILPLRKPKGIRWSLKRCSRKFIGSLNLIL